MSSEAMNLPEVPPAPKVEPFASEPDVMDAAKAAELLGVATATIRREIDRGNLEAFHVGRCVRIKKAALISYIEQGGGIDD